MLYRSNDGEGGLRLRRLSGRATDEKATVEKGTAEKNTAEKNTDEKDLQPAPTPTS